MQRREVLKYLSGYAGATALSSSHARMLASALTSPSPRAANPGEINFNQLGFVPSGEKLATVRPEASHFAIRRSQDNTIAFHGALGEPRKDEASGETVRIANFSGLKTSGIYLLELESGIRSAPFSIAGDAYQHALWLTTRAFYGQRCNCEVDLGDGYAHPKCHLSAAFHPSSGKTGTFGDYGGWHDAGDYGRYIVNSGIATGTLLWAWELYEHSLRNINLKIPETGGAVPDFLAEIQWNLKWMLSLQDVDGGVWQKQTSENFCPFIMPQQDHSISYVIGTASPPHKSTCATADLAAVAAIAARCYGACDPAFAQRCLIAARRAWKWCEQNPDVIFRNPKGITTGEYADPNCSDELLWATAELWRTTGDEEFHQAFLARLPHPMEQLSVQVPSWNQLSPMAYWTYALAPRKGHPNVTKQIRNATIATARKMIQQSNWNGYGNTLASGDYMWGSNGVAANHSLLLLIANKFEPHTSFTNSAWKNLDYILGRNCFGISWVTQLGVNPFLHPHHRPSVADGLPKPWPGLMSGGPNAHPADAVMKTLPIRAPMRMYIDNAGAYSCNEIAINWNAPLVFTLAAANSPKP